MAKEGLRSTLALAMYAVGVAMATEPVLETYNKPPHEIASMFEKRQARYGLQEAGGAILMLMAGNYSQEKKSDRIEYLLLMWAPNVLNPQKLASNLRHPVHEVLHTHHIQHPITMKEGVEYHVVEHKLGPKLVTIDVVKPTPLARGVIPRIKQLFGKRFYFGHAEYFPEPFELVDRTFVRKGFDKEEHLKKFEIPKG